MLDLDTWVVLVPASVTQVNVSRFESHSGRLHQDARLLNLLMQRVAVVGVARKDSGFHDQVAF